MLLALIAVFAMPVEASSNYIRTTQPNESEAILTGQDGETMDYEVWVYGLSIYADAASSFFGLYDADTYAELIATTTYARDEIGEPTQYEYTDKWYPNPIKYLDGLGMIIKTGVGFVHYGPAPSSSL